MGRRAAGRPSLDSSIVTLTNNSILEDKLPQEYSEFIKRFRIPELKPNFAGYTKTINEIKDKIENPLKSKTVKNNFALITGPAGTGKTSIIRNLAQQYAKPDGDRPQLAFFYLKASWTLRRQFGNPEIQIKELFEEAIQKSPSIVFIDRLDRICGDKKQGESKDRAICDVIEDELENVVTSSATVIVFAATNRPEVIDPQLRDSYFNDEIKVLLPNEQDRLEILRELTKDEHLNLNQLQQIASLSHCYSYKDLCNLCDVASRDIQIRGKVGIDFLSLKNALSSYKPTAIRSITKPYRQIRWSDIGGGEEVKRELIESVIWPLEHRNDFKELGICFNKGALLYGPPGCSKTMLAQALATESGYNFISVKGPELYTKYVGDSEAAVRRIYRNAREIAPCIIFFDEIDGLAPERNDNQSSSVGDKMVTQLLTELNEVGPFDNVFTIAATNRPDRVDNALLRPGRLDPAIYIPLPTQQDRAAILRVHMRPLKLRLDEPIENLVESLASKTAGYSGAELANICRVAGVLALREGRQDKYIEWKHFTGALDKVGPRTRAKHLKAYENFQKEFPRLGDEGTPDDLEQITIAKQPSGNDSIAIPSQASPAYVRVYKGLINLFARKKRSIK